MFVKDTYIVKCLCLCVTYKLSHSCPLFLFQKKFENELTLIWKRAGLKKPPEGWQTPVLFLRKSK